MPTMFQALLNPDSIFQDEHFYFPYFVLLWLTLKCNPVSQKASQLLFIKTISNQNQRQRLASCVEIFMNTLDHFSDLPNSFHFHPLLFSHSALSHVAMHNEAGSGRCRLPYPLPVRLDSHQISASRCAL